MIRSENIRLLIIGLSMVAIQVVLLRHLKIFGAESDLVLLFILWLCAGKSRTTCLLFAGFLGLLQDSMTDLWGLNMFSKTALVFLIHGILHRISENKLIVWQVFLIILASAFFHNVFFYFATLFSEAYATEYVFWTILVFSSVFTALVGSFLHLVRVDI